MKRIKCLPFTLQSPAILDLSLRKSRSGKSHNYRDALFSKTSVLQFEECFEKLRFCSVDISPAYCERYLTCRDSRALF